MFGPKLSNRGGHSKVSAFILMFSIGFRPVISVAYIATPQDTVCSSIENSLKNNPQNNDLYKLHLRLREAVKTSNLTYSEKTRSFVFKNSDEGAKYTERFFKKSKRSVSNYQEISREYDMIQLRILAATL